MRQEKEEEEEEEEKIHKFACEHITIPYELNPGTCEAAPQQQKSEKEPLQVRRFCEDQREFLGLFQKSIVFFFVSCGGGRCLIEIRDSKTVHIYLRAQS